MDKSVSATEERLQSDIANGSSDADAESSVQINDFYDATATDRPVINGARSVDCFGRCNSLPILPFRGWVSMSCYFPENCALQMQGIAPLVVVINKPANEAFLKENVLFRSSWLLRLPLV